MTRRWLRYVGAAYRPAFHLPFMVLWAVGLTGLFAAAAGVARDGRSGAGLAATTVTLVINMLVLRALDDIRDHDYDRRHNPGRPLPSGVVRERDLVALVAAGIAAMLLVNAGRGVVLAVLAGQLGYALAVIAVDRRLGWPGDRPVLHLAVNLPIQSMLSLYVYAGFLRGSGRGPDATGLLAVLAVTLAALCLELGRKTVRARPTGERTYVTVWGAPATSAAALGAAVAGTAIVLAVLEPWHGTPRQGWGWLVLMPLVLPAVAAAQFAGGARRWPATPTRAYVPAMYASLLLVGWLMTGAPA